VDVSHKRRTIRLLPEEQPSKLSRLSKRNILVGSAEEVDRSLESLNEQSQKDWEVKWQSS
jgi:hypothetical protein